MNPTFWLLNSYEYAKGSFVATSSILNAAVTAGHPVNSVSLGMWIKRIWNDKVKKEDYRGSDGSGYRNLLERTLIPNSEPLLVINESALNSINQSLEKHQDWFIASKSFEEQRIVLMKSGSQIVDKCIDGQRGVLQMCVYLLPTPEIMFCAHTREISMKRIMGVENITVSLSSIDLAIRFLEAANWCVGQPVPYDTYGNYRIPVSNSTVVSVTTQSMQPHEDMKFLVSLSCSMFSFAPPHPTTGVISCQDCSYVFTLFQRRMNKRRKSESHQRAPHPKCNERYMAMKCLESKMQDQRNQLKKEKCQRLKEEDYVEFVDEDHADLIDVVKTVDTRSLPPQMKLLWDAQMKQLAVKSAKGHRWDPRIVRFALDLYCKSPKALDSMREFVILPSNRLIRYYKNAVNQGPGWNREVILWCKREAERQGLKDHDYWGGFIIDEMKIQEDLQMTVKSGKHCLTGIVSLGDFHDAVEGIKSGESSVQLATHLLQFIFLSDSGFRFPLAHFPTTQCSPSVLYLQFWEGVMQMKRAGFTIYHMICDGADSNRQFINIHFPRSNPRDLNFTGYNLLTGDPMIFMMDCKHNIKKLRNNVEKSSNNGKRMLTKDGKNIYWSHWREAYSWDQKSNSFPVHERLKEDHFNLTPSSRMRNGLAEDVLDKRMLFLMQAYKDHLKTIRCEDPDRLDMTILFLRHTSRMVELFSDKHAIYLPHDTRIQNLNESLRFFSEWHQQATNGKEFVSAKLWFDLQSMIVGFTAMVKTKLSRFPGTLIKPAITNQDVIENHFSQLRGANGQNENPTYQLTQGTQNSIIFGQTTISKKCNTGGVENGSFAGLPKETIFGKNNKTSECDPITGLLLDESIYT